MTMSISRRCCVVSSSWCSKGSRFLNSMIDFSRECECWSMLKNTWISGRLDSGIWLWCFQWHCTSECKWNESQMLDEWTQCNSDHVSVVLDLLSWTKQYSYSKTHFFPDRESRTLSPFFVIFWWFFPIDDAFEAATHRILCPRTSIVIPGFSHRTNMYHLRRGHHCHWTMIHEKAPKCYQSLDPSNYHRAHDRR